jgi:hypothetical protein
MSFFSIKKTHSTVFCYHNTSSLKETPSELIDHTFAEARHWHDQPLAAKMVLRRNEPNNGHMAIGKYAVYWIV